MISPAKPSRPARAYLHLLKKDDMLSLSESVRAATWDDAKNTFTSPVLVGPPSLELSSYKKVPGNKKRTDARQGTIDQDPEFMAFLEGLANPAPFRESIDTEEADDGNKGDTKVTTTPLVEYLKEKKANKSKDSGSGKKRGDGKNRGKDDESSKKKGRESKTDKVEKPERGSKTTVKILTKKAATEQAADAAKNAAKAINDAISQEAPKSRRAGIATAARILQRDLGLSPGSAHRRARQDAAKAEATAKSKDPGPLDGTQNQAPRVGGDAASTQDGKAKANTATGKSQTGRKGRDTKGKAAESPSAAPTATAPPVILKKKVDNQAATSSDVASAVTSTQKSVATKSGTTDKNGKAANAGSKAAQSQKKPQSITASATKAFIKHAVQSQGVTEAALRQALEPMGTITAIEMDKRKAFAYVDFANHDGLVKAVNASPLTVGQGSVQILERKDKKTQPTSAATSNGTGDKEKAKENDKDKEKGSETRRGRRGRGGKGNNTGATSNSQTANTTTPTNSG